MFSFNGLQSVSNLLFYHHLTNHLPAFFFPTTKIIYFSVIIPVYNCERYLKSAIDSVLNQPVKELEIILNDADSTDGSNKICDFYSNKYENISVIRQKNQGVSIKVFL